MKPLILAFCVIGAVFGNEDVFSREHEPVGILSFHMACLKIGIRYHERE